MNTKDAIQKHLTMKNFEMPDGSKVQSCLTAALNEARYITARKLESGQPDDLNTHGSLGRWTGAMCYMTILDQIGTCYRLKSHVSINNKSSIIRSLKYFTDLNDETIETLYALRNAFFHDFSLINFSATHPLRQHHFRVDNHPTNPIVVLPQEKWDGNLQTRYSGNGTYVNLKTLGDLVESIYIKLLELESKDELEIILSNGPAELLNRYSYLHR